MHGANMKIFIVYLQMPIYTSLHYGKKQASRQNEVCSQIIILCI